MDPQNNVGQLTLDLTELSVLWVQPLKHYRHGIHLLRTWVCKRRCSMRSFRWSSTTSIGASPWNNLWYGCILLHGSNLIILNKCLLSSLLSWCSILWAIRNWRSHRTIHMAIVFGPRAFLQQGINNLDSLWSSNLKANMLQQFRDEESKWKCTTMERGVMVGGDVIDNHLTTIHMAWIKQVVDWWILVWWDKG